MNTQPTPDHTKKKYLEIMDTTTTTKKYFSMGTGIGFILKHYPHREKKYWIWTATLKK